jgi:CRISPR-associated protein Cas5t
LLTDIRFAVWVRKGELERNDIPLASRVRAAFDVPSGVKRFGGLSLGESTHLVDEVRLLETRAESCQVLVAEDDGDLSLPIWPDHVGSVTTWGQYSLRQIGFSPEPPSADDVWTKIRRRSQ